MILSDGRAVSCEQDIAGHQVVGDLNTQSLADVWNAGMAPLREAHSTGCFDSPVCRACAEWHRP